MAGLRVGRRVETITTVIEYFNTVALARPMNTLHHTINISSILIPVVEKVRELKYPPLPLPVVGGATAGG